MVLKWLAKILGSSRITEITVGSRVTTSGKYSFVNDYFEKSDAEVIEITPNSLAYTGGAFVKVRFDSGSEREFYYNALKTV